MLLFYSLHIHQPNGISPCLLLLTHPFPWRLSHCRRQAVLFGLSPNGWRVFVVKLNSKSVVMGSSPTHLAGETNLESVPFSNCLRSWYHIRIQGKSHIMMKNMPSLGLALCSHIFQAHCIWEVWVAGRIQLLDILDPGPNTISFHPLAWFTFGPVSAEHICGGNLKLGGKCSKKEWD